MIKIGIYDDDINIINMFKLIFKNHFNSESELVIYHSRNDLIQHSYEIDILYLDIKINEENGLEIGKEIRKFNKDIVIIIISSFDSYLLSSFGIHPFNYLIKPITEEKIIEVYKDAKNYLQNHTYKILKVEMNSQTYFVDSRRIMYIERRGRKIYIVEQNKEYEMYGTIKDIYQVLHNYGFIMCHNAIIVNFKYISSFNSNTVFINHDIALPISQRKHHDFIFKLNKLLLKER